MTSRGAQVGVASLAVNYLVDQNIGIDQSWASQLYSYCQITFAVARYFSCFCMGHIPILMDYQIHWVLYPKLGRSSADALNLRAWLLCILAWSCLRRRCTRRWVFVCAFLLRVYLLSGGYNAPVTHVGLLTHKISHAGDIYLGN